LTDLKIINQIANFAPIEWPTNIKIGKQPPAAYIPALDATMTSEQREHAYKLHALPPLWWELDYNEFLVARRLRMAQVVRKHGNCFVARLNLNLHHHRRSPN